MCPPPPPSDHHNLCPTAATSNDHQRVLATRWWFPRLPCALHREVFTLPPVFRAESEDSPRTVRAVRGQSELSEHSPRTPLGLNSDDFWLMLQPNLKFRVRI